MAIADKPERVDGIRIERAHHRVLVLHLAHWST
jgi:hypothetical protein